MVKGLVSVIMSNYNTPESYLREAIESVLNQTYTDFELIIIDDCSTDNSLEIIREYKDERIIVLENEVNMGITKSLNRGLSVSRGEFVARMDADDICFPQRFEKQVKFLSENSQYIVCGAGAELIGDWQGKYTNKVICRKIPSRDLYRVHLLFGNNPNIVHPTAMFNRRLLIENNVTYNENYLYAQDYRMWVTCSQYGECINYPETLLYYRIHGGAVSSSKAAIQHNCVIMNMREQLSSIGIELTEEYEDIHFKFMSNREHNLKYKEWLLLLIKQNKKYGVYNQKYLEKILWEKWAEVIYFALRRQKSPVGILKLLLDMPPKYIKELFKIRKRRAEKS